MKGKLALLFGFAAGYVLGAQAGRERYEQILSWFNEATGRASREVSQSWPGVDQPTG